VKEPGGCSFPYFHATIFKVLGKLEFLKFWEGAHPHNTAGDRGTGVNNLPKVQWPGVELITSQVASQCLNHSTAGQLVQPVKISTKHQPPKTRAGLRPNRAWCCSINSTHLNAALPKAQQLDINTDLFLSSRNSRLRITSSPSSPTLPGTPGTTIPPPCGKDTTPPEEPSCWTAYYMHCWHVELNWESISHTNTNRCALFSTLWKDLF